MTTGATMATVCNTTPRTRHRREFDPGVVERRIIAYFFEGIKRKLYDWSSMRWGRDSQEAETFKDEVRKIIKGVRQMCYDMVTEELDGAPQLSGDALAEIIRYALPPEGHFWSKLNDLLGFTFGNQAAAIKKFITPGIETYIAHRLPNLSTNYGQERTGAIEYLRRTKRR